MKLSAILRIACGLADSCRSVTHFQISIEPDQIVISPVQEQPLNVFSIPEQDVDYFNRVFACPLKIK